ncbi:hypothetical protein NDI56_01680 [Haloarcula sp. S1CR25-12]|uniref:DUF7827 domain-containing protein n=1 Tax=Haloarcula saliterrae TaxID=2950534 RepID=A0ABU2F785_9EURY|nr:hypothetical protein [Haloarcula sp. S1CR25-12]MDS0258114.1 hypothetical protein [Haloarcula sp. S1CR25-12]
MGPTRLSLLVCSLVLVSGLLAGASAADSPVALDDPPENETLGDVVELTVSVPENGTATVVVEESKSAAYSRELRLRDTSGDGRVTLRINTFLGNRSANETAVYSVGEGDSVRIEEQSGDRITTTRYDVAVFDGTATQDEPADTASVELTAPTGGTVSYAAAPSNATDRLTTREDIQRGQREDWVIQSERLSDPGSETPVIATNDTMLLELRVDGIEGALAASSGTNDTDRFFSALDRQNASLRLEWRNPSIESPDVHIPLNRTNVAHVVTDGRNDSYTFVVDTAEAKLTPSAVGTRDGRAEFDPQFTVDGESRDLDGDSVDFEVRDGAVYSRVAIDGPPDDETLGDVVELTVVLPENDTATLVVAGRAGEYSRELRVDDASGDGGVTLRINTYLGAQGANETAVYSARDGDEVAVRERRGTNLTASEYSIEVYDGTVSERDPDDTETIRLAAPTDGNVSYLTAPANASDRLETHRDIERGREAGWVTESSTVTAGETLLVRLRVDGFGGALAASRAPNGRVRFPAMLDRANTTLQGVTPEGSHRYPYRLPLNRTNVATVVTDRQNETYYFVLDTVEPALTPATNDEEGVSERVPDHRDTYLIGGPPVGQSVPLQPAPTVENDPSTETRARTDTAEATAVTTTAGDGPGFGVLTALVAALLGTVAARQRR